MINNNNASITDDFIQFVGSKGQLITTSCSNFTLLRGKDNFTAFFGSGYRAEITAETFNDIHLLLGLGVPGKAKVIEEAKTEDEEEDDLTFNVPS